MSASKKDVYRRAKAGCPTALKALRCLWDVWINSRIRDIRQYAFQHQLVVLDVAELQAEVWVILHEALKHLNTERSEGECNSYLRQMIHYGLWQWAKKQWKHRQECKPTALDLEMNQRSLWISVSFLDDLITKERHQQVRRTVKHYCTPDEQDYLEHRYGLEAIEEVKSIQAFAQELGVSYQAVRMKEKRLLLRLRRVLGHLF
jgi:hypothetical protein